MPRRRRNPSVMRNAFASLPTVTRRRSIFNRSSALKTTIPFDKVVPIYVDEVLPGDTFKMKLSYVMRLPALQVPIYDNIHCSIHFFYVPNRLLWKNWKTFIAGSDQPWQWNTDAVDAYGNIQSVALGTTDVDSVNKLKEQISYSEADTSNVLRVPQCMSPAQGYRRGSIYDLFGLPTGVGNFRHSALPLRAYDLIWNEYYRDENLQASVVVLDGDDEVVQLSDGKAVKRLYQLRPRNKRYDYFTSAQPRPQKGNDSLVQFQVTPVNTYKPFGISDEKATDAFNRYPVHGFRFTSSHGNKGGFNIPGALNSWLDLHTSSVDGSDYVYLRQAPTYYATRDQLPDQNRSVWDGAGFYGEVSLENNRIDFQKIPVYTNASVHYDGPVDYVNGIAKPQEPLTESNWPLYVDIPKKDATPVEVPPLHGSFTIADLRAATVMQHWAEACARYGTRYNEAIAGHFGVQVGDYRVQRPEFLGGCKFLVNVSPIAQTSRTEGNAALGELAGIAASSDTKRLFTKSFVEHGLIIGLASFYSDLTYYQGVDRNPWLHENRFDFFWPEFAHLGPQPIYNKEIFCKSDTATFESVQESGYYDSDIGDDAIRALPANYLPFGYQERYAEYRFKNSRVAGYMRPLEPGHSPSDTNWTFKNWILTQEFKDGVNLNSDFIECNTPLSNVLARQSANGQVPAKYHVVLSDFYFHLKCVRPLPVYATPGLSRL